MGASSPELACAIKGNFYFAVLVKAKSGDLAPIVRPHRQNAAKPLRHITICAQRLWIIC